jgi:predicted MPP superfamily phosphohydrolase
MHKESALTDGQKTAWTALAAGTAALTGILLAASEYERSCLTTAEYTIKTEKPLQKERKLLFLTDLHDRQFGFENRRLVALAEAVSPDAILLGGDMMTVKKSADIMPTIDFLEELTERFPVYYGNGNHETRLRRDRGRYGDLYDDLLRALKDMGVIHLANSSAMLDRDIRITGLDITENYYRKWKCDRMDSAYIESRVGPAATDCFQILLAHSPFFFDAYRAWGADLTLSGHNHGGTICLPGGIGLMTPQFTFFSDEVKGRKDRDGKTLLISPGLGTHSVNIRLNNKPQAVVVKLVRK